MPYDPEKHHRRSIRLKGYDYAQPGRYFVTACLQDNMCLFGQVVGGIMGLNPAGQMIHAVWNALPARYPGVTVDAFVAMPNHIHGIIVLTGGSGVTDRSHCTDSPNSGVGAPLVGARNDAETSHQTERPRDAEPPERAPTRDAPTTNTPVSLGAIVGAFKSITTMGYIDGVKNSGWPRFNKRLWQRNYYEHVIRGRRDLDRIRRYIAENPTRWGRDRYYPDFFS